MKRKNNLRLIGDILFRPVQFFSNFRAEPGEFRAHLVSYGMPLLVLAAAGRMTRIMLLQEMQGQSMARFQLAGLFIVSLTAYALSVWLGAYFVHRLAPRFQTEADHDKTMLLIIFAYTPYFLAQPLSVLTPGLNPLLIVGILYTVYLFGRGSGPMLNTPGNKVIGFTLVSYFVIFGISHLGMLILSELFIFAGS